MAYKRRLVKPEAGNPYYNTKANGGYSDAIKGSPTDAGCDVLANCVGYAYGRFNEIGGYGYCKYLRPVNAENFIQYKGSLLVGQTPKLGACMVWRKGNTLSNSDGAGHVAIVEKINSPTQIVTSESGWGSTSPFWTKTRNKGADGNWGAGSAYTFLGFIYNPAVKESDQEPSTGSDYAQGKDNEHTIFNFLTAVMELNTAAACGVIANIKHESGFDPNIYGDAGTSYGICQWHNTRFASLKEYCNQAGKRYDTLDGQLRYLKHELESGYKSVLSAIKAVPNTEQGSYDAAYVWCVRFEIPANKEQMGAVRGSTAKQYFAKYTGDEADGGASSGGTNSGAGVYTVKQGDTLFEIALRHGTTYQELAAYNGITNPHRIYVGQTIRIPGEERTENGTYTVVRGDTLWGIASRLLGNGNRYREIKAMNGLTSDTIYVGQVLNIPEK